MSHKCTPILALIVMLLSLAGCIEKQPVTKKEQAIYQTALPEPYICTDDFRSHRLIDYPEPACIDQRLGGSIMSQRLEFQMCRKEVSCYINYLADVPVYVDEEASLIANNLLDSARAYLSCKVNEYRKYQQECSSDALKKFIKNNASQSGYSAAIADLDKKQRFCTNRYMTGVDQCTYVPPKEAYVLGYDDPPAPTFSRIYHRYTFIHPDEWEEPPDEVLSNYKKQLVDWRNRVVEEASRKAINKADDVTGMFNCWAKGSSVCY